MDLIYLLFKIYSKGRDKYRIDYSNLIFHINNNKEQVIKCTVKTSTSL